MIPFYLKTSGVEESAEATHYLIAANGVFLVKRTRLFASVTEAKTLNGLEQQSPCVSLSFPKVPRPLLEQIYGFFQSVYDRFDGEAVVFIYYSPELSEFQASPPPQKLTRFRTRRGWRTTGSVEYEAIPRPKGFLKLGDAHSHCDSPAFFSSVDDRDDGEDGLRVVLGRLDRPQPEVRVSFVANGTRFLLEANEVLEEFSQPLPAPEAWMRRVVCRHENLRHGPRTIRDVHGWS